MLIVESNTKPLTVEYHIGNTYINTNVKVLSDGTMFRYNQERLIGAASKSEIEAAIIRSYDQLIQNESMRVAGALRSKTLGVSVDYDEAILLDAEVNCAALYAELSTTLSNLNV